MARQSKAPAKKAAAKSASKAASGKATNGTDRQHSRTKAKGKDRSASAKVSTRKQGNKDTAFDFGANKQARISDPTKRYPKKIYDLSDLPIKKYKTFRNITRELDDKADELDAQLLPEGGKLAIRIERSQDASGKGRKYNSSRRIFDSFKELGHYLRGSNSLDRNNELVGHIQILQFKNLYNSQVWKADEDIKAGKRMLKKAQQKERQLLRHKATVTENKKLKKELASAKDQLKRAEKNLREALTVQRSRKFGTKKTSTRKPQPGGRKKK